MMKFKLHDTIYNQPDEVFEAFKDILECIDSRLFQNIEYDALEGVLEYDTQYGEHCIKPFDMTQGTPEVTADVMQWLFSMLDASANI